MRTVRRTWIIARWAIPLLLGTILFLPFLVSKPKWNPRIVRGKSVGLFTNDLSAQISSAHRLVQRFLTVYADIIETNYVDPRFWKNFSLMSRVETQCYTSPLGQSVVLLRPGREDSFTVECFQDPAMMAMSYDLDPHERAQRVPTGVLGRTNLASLRALINKAKRRHALGIEFADTPVTSSFQNIILSFSNSVGVIVGVDCLGVLQNCRVVMNGKPSRYFDSAIVLATGGLGFDAVEEKVDEVAAAIVGEEFRAIYETFAPFRHSRADVVLGPLVEMILEKRWQEEIGGPTYLAWKEMEDIAFLEKKASEMGAETNYVKLMLEKKPARKFAPLGGRLTGPSYASQALLINLIAAGVYYMARAHWRRWTSWRVFLANSFLGCLGALNYWVFSTRPEWLGVWIAAPCLLFFAIAAWVSRDLMKYHADKERRDRERDNQAEEGSAGPV